jgi:predicted enzyme related to lactoylglutathione lyase
MLSTLNPLNAASVVSMCSPFACGVLKRETGVPVSPLRFYTEARHIASPEPKDNMDWKIELIAVPVTDVDRAIDFYAHRVGFVLDHDNRVSDEMRFVQLTPPGSACSIAFGEGITEMPPGSQKGIQIVIENADAARAQLVEAGVTASDVDVQPWGRFVYFDDPDSNSWSLQELPHWS